MVEAKEAAEVIKEVAEEPAQKSERYPLNRLVAVLVAALAVLLAIATISTGAATRRLLNDNIHLSDLHAQQDVGDVRQSNASVTADLIESMLATTNPSEATRAILQQKIDQYRAAAISSEATNGALKALAEEIAKYDGLETTTETQILNYEYAEVILQIGIVLSSLAILTASWAIFYIAGGLGVVGLILIINGYILSVALPTLH